MARAFGYNRVQTFRKVLWPPALSYNITGIRIAVGRGIVVVVAECFGSRADPSGSIL